jgi:hypothetical protein
LQHLLSTDKEAEASAAAAAAAAAAAVSAGGVDQQHVLLLWSSPYLDNLVLVVNVGSKADSGSRWEGSRGGGGGGDCA